MKRSEQLRKGPEEFSQNCDVIGKLRGKGLIIGVEIVEAQKTEVLSVEFYSASQVRCARHCPYASMRDDAAE